MTPDPSDLDFIDQVCREDDRLRREREWEAAQRRSADAPVQKTGPDGLVFKQHANSAPARALT
jgi:hypothetical protein